MILKHWKYILIGILTLLLIFECSGDKPEVKTKTVTKEIVKTVTDTVKEVVIQKPEKVYIKITDTIYEEKVVYVQDSIKVNKYPLKLISNKAEFNGFAYTDGKLYDFEGVITYPEKIIETTTEKIIKRDKSGLFGFMQSDLNLQNYGIGLDYQIRNKLILGASITHNTQFNNTNINFKLGIKIK